jgi:hypothetical protein
MSRAATRGHVAKSERGDDASGSTIPQRDSEERELHLVHELSFQVIFRRKFPIAAPTSLLMVAHAWQMAKLLLACCTFHATIPFHGQG